MRYLADENFNGSILRALQRLAPEVDVVRVQDVALAGADDPSVLAWAASEGRVVLTHDVNTMPDYAYQRLTAGLEMPGLLLVPWRLAVSEAVESLLLVDGASLPEELNSQVRFLPV